MANKKAFTLIEFLTVIVIIGLILALLFPVISRIRAKGYITACASNMRQIGFALQIYAEEHNGKYPPGHLKKGKDFNKDDLSPLFPGYIDDLNVFMCPAAKVRVPKDQWVSKEEHLTRSRTNDEIGIDYEYRGRQEPYDEALEWGEMPSWKRADEAPTTYVLIYDNDNRGPDPQAIDPEDNHGAAGGNKLFSDGSVRWYPADKWAYPLPDGTDWNP